MVNTIILCGLAVVLMISLLARRLPRRFFFEIMEVAAQLYVLGFCLSLYVTNKYWPNQIDGPIPYLVPIIPVVVLLAFLLPRIKRKRA